MDPTILKGIGILPKHEVFSIFDERTWKEAVAILKGMLGKHLHILSKKKYQNCGIQLLIL